MNKDFYNRKKVAHLDDFRVENDWLDEFILGYFLEERSGIPPTPRPLRTESEWRRWNLFVEIQQEKPIVGWNFRGDPDEES